jgi:hypothetical protein
MIFKALALMAAGGLTQQMLIADAIGELRPNSDGVSEFDDCGQVGIVFGLIRSYSLTSRITCS